ncbi:MAG TPA: site-specific integrase [Polyangiaceae bacterium]
MDHPRSLRGVALRVLAALARARPRGLDGGAGATSLAAFRARAPRTASPRGRGALAPAVSDSGSASRCDHPRGGIGSAGATSARHATVVSEERPRVGSGWNHTRTAVAAEAGFRRGETMALEWSDVDLRRGQLTIERSEWKSEVTATKGMTVRVVPMTQRLQKALAAFRHFRGDRVLYADGGSSVTAKVLQKWMAQAQRRANLRATGAIHILRHTFCSHLAMKGAPALSIRHLAGHEHLQTTLSYMHLAKGETERAIGLLETPITSLSVHGNGNLTATEHSADQNTAS